MGMFVYWGWLWQRCPFPIGWLINRGVSSETPEKQQTTGFYDDRWDWPAPGPNLFWPKGHYCRGCGKMIYTQMWKNHTENSHGCGKPHDFRLKKMMRVHWWIFRVELLVYPRE
jgi:hypothetical protein